ncbi:MAG: SprT family zinc-dependent metalloprotease [Candidatus Omnitrophota bacterium]|nr:SprT family zinc-dependent metalloprotease [Candidatus Omnitrophota bacterium]
MTQLTVGEIKADVLKKNIKNLHLRVYAPTGSVRITAPLRMTLDAIQAFALSKLDWIKKQRQRLMHQERQTHSIEEGKTDEWCRTNLREALPALVEAWEAAMGVQVKECRIKKMKTRWGTCNTKARRIWINLELARRPSEWLEYVIVHEMAHLIESGHGPRFRALMDKYLPGWRLRKDELRHVYNAHL